MNNLKVDWDEIDKSKFPHILKRYRLYRGYTQAELAKKVGLNNTTISNYENGVSLPDLNTIVKIARILKVDPGEFYVGWQITRFRSEDDYSDVVPSIIQVERDFVSCELTKWFVAMPAVGDFYKCRAVIVPRKIVREDDRSLYFVVVAPVDEYKEGDVVVAVVNKNETFIGVYGNSKSGNKVIRPIKKWNPDNKIGVLIEQCVSCNIIGKVISYHSYEHNI